MKKLLALVLCVMMFVSVLSTNAFAAKATVAPHPDIDTGSLIDTPRAASNNKAVKNAKENIEYMYGALAADNAVFGTIKSMDSVISSIAKDMFKDVDDYLGIPGGKLESNTKTVLRDYIGSSIVDYLDDHMGNFATVSQDFRVQLADGTMGSLTYTGKSTSTGDPIYINADGVIYAHNAAGWWIASDKTNVTMAENDDIFAADVNWTAAGADTVTLRTQYKYDPIKYANTFAAAVNDAFNSKDGASLIEAMVYQIYAAKVYDALDDKFGDLYDEIVDWEDGNAILSQYHFHDTEPNGGVDVEWDTHHVFNPYAMMNLDNYPNGASDVLDAILVP